MSSIRRVGTDGGALVERPTAAYEGCRLAPFQLRVWRVHEDGGTSPLPPRNDLRNHSPDGFEWGYGGSGPSQLALAILCDAVGDRAAVEHYCDFKWQRIARLSQDVGAGWRITRAEVLEWIARRQDERSDS